MLAKLHNLKEALILQEHTLSAWPDSPSKERICAALTTAKRPITQIVDDIERASDSTVADAKAS